MSDSGSLGSVTGRTVCGSAAALAVAGCLGGDDGPTAPVEAFYRASDDGDLDRARDLLHPQSVVGTGVYPLREREIAAVDASLVDRDLDGAALEERFADVGGVISAEGSEADAETIAESLEYDAVAAVRARVDPGGDRERYERPWLVPRVDGAWLLYAPIPEG